jgi:hypothetical protein
MTSPLVSIKNLSVVVTGAVANVPSVVLPAELRRGVRQAVG